MEKLDVGSIATSEKASLEAIARRERYAFLESVRMRYDARYVITAHHAVDQTETIIGNMIKGAKVRGLSGMSIVSRTPFVKVSSLPLLGDELYRRRDKGDLVPEKNPQSLRDSSFAKELTGTIFRPLLTTPKSDILEYAHEHHVEYREDSTNTDTTYDRNRIRHDIIPVLESLNPSIHHSV
jgi:tRNA(Ile)-lysidine synthase